MKIRNLVGLIIQLMAIQFLLGILLNSQLIGFSLGNSQMFGQETISVWPYRIYFLIAVALALLMCAFAKDIAGRLIAGDDVVALGNLTVVDAYTIAFFVVGIGFLFGSVVDTVYFAVDFLRLSMTPTTERFDFWAVLRTFVPPIIGFALVLNARSLATSYAAKQDDVPMSPSQDQPPSSEERSSIDT